MGFTVIGVINGVLLQETFKVAHHDDVVMVRTKQRAMRSHVEKMQTLFAAADVSGDGQVSLEELRSLMKEHPDARTWLAALDLEINDLEEVFALLDDGDGKLTADELVHGVAKLRGTAKSLDLAAVRSMLGRQEKELKVLAWSFRMAFEEHRDEGYSL